MSDLTPHLTVDEAAKILRVSPSWLYGEARARRIPHQRPGRKVTFTVDQVKAIEKKLAVEPAVDTPNLTGLSPRSRYRRHAARQARAG